MYSIMTSTKKRLAVFAVLVFVAVLCYLFYSRRQISLHSTGSAPVQVDSVPVQVENRSNTVKVVHDSSAYERLRHPKTIEQMWITISKRFIVRRLAYLDKRNKDHAVIQLITLHDRRSEKPKPPLFLKLYGDNDFSSSCLSTKSTEGFAHGPSEDDFLHYLITSSDLSQKQLSLSHVTVSTDESCNSESAPIYIQTIQPNRACYTYGVCLHKALLANVAPQTLLDWVKLNIAMGAEIITIYLQTVPEELYTILMPYIAKGTVEVLDWKVEKPFADSPSRHGGQTATIAECIYYNMDRVKYLGLMDLDEFLVPQKHNSVQELLRQLEADPVANKAASYRFWNANMYGNGKPLPEAANCTSIKQLPVYFSNTRVCVIKDTAVTKMIAKPIASTIGFGHFLLKAEIGYTVDYMVPSELGLSQHYRKGWNDAASFLRCNSSPKQTYVMSRFFRNVTGC